MAQIKDLPVGWEWVPAGKETYFPSPGVSSTARHAKNTLSGQTMSLRQAQNIQRSARALRGQPKGPTTPRRGKTRTIRGAYGSNSTLYDPERHGRTETLVFRSLADAQSYAVLNGLPSWANIGVIHIRYTERLTTTNRVGSDKLDKNGFATITGFFEPDKNSGPEALVPSRGIVPKAWEQARERIVNYDMTGSRARVYIVLSEK